ncbi:MAG: flagellar assembly protein FliX [Pseudomonadota bacterium]
MKISQTGPGVPTGRSRKAGAAGRADADGAFRRHIDMDGPPSANAPTSTMPLTALGSLLAVQEVPDPMAGKKRAVQHGDSILDELRDLQVELVEGRVSEGTLRSLAHMLDQPRPAIDDPGLNQVLDDIELRAAVELAKLEQQST